jgi:hypothetical protein
VRGNRLGLYRAIFGALLFFPVGYALSTLPGIGIADDPPQRIEWWIRYHPNACAAWIVIGAILGWVWHLIERSKNSN